MPSKSKKQARLMAAVAHNPEFAKKVGIPQKVGREFNQADKGTGILRGPIRKADGGKVEAFKSLADKIKAYHELSQAQRGKPEIAMLKAQEAMGGGVMSHALEHVGDLIHRMSERLEYGTETGRGTTSEKTGKMLRLLTNPYGFLREHDENMVSNARYMQRPIEEQLAAEQKALQEYMLAHQELTPYNDVQKLANLAAIHLAKKDIPVAVNSIRQIDKFTKDKDLWKAEVLKADGGKVSQLSLSDLITPKKKPSNANKIAKLARDAGPEGGAEVRARIALGLLSQIYGVDERGNAKFGKLPGLINETLAIPTLAGDSAPDWAKRAADRSTKLHSRLREEMDVPEPEGFWQGADEGLGVMMGQLPIAGAGMPSKVKNALPFLDSSAAKIATLPIQFLTPTIEPSLGAYLGGAAFGGVSNDPDAVTNPIKGALAEIAEPLAFTGVLDTGARGLRNMARLGAWGARNFVRPVNLLTGGALSGIMDRLDPDAEERLVAKKAKGGKVSDIKKLVKLAHRYADGGSVKGTSRAIGIIKEAISHLEAGDTESALRLLNSSPEAMREPGVAELVSKLTAPAMARGGKMHEEPDGDEGIHGPALGGDGDGDEKMRMAKGGKVRAIQNLAKALGKYHDVINKGVSASDGFDVRDELATSVGLKPEDFEQHMQNALEHLYESGEDYNKANFMKSAMATLQPKTDPSGIATAPRGPAQGAKSKGDTYFTTGGIWRKDGTPVTDPAEIEAVAKKFKLHGLKPNPTYADSPEVAFDLDLPDDRRFKKFRNQIDGEDGAIHLEDKDHTAYFTLPR